MSNIADNDTKQTIFDEFISRNAPKQKTFYVYVQSGDRFTFRVTDSADELKAIKAEARKFVLRAIKDKKGSGPIDELRDLSRDAEVFSYSFHLQKRFVKYERFSLVDEVPVFTEVPLFSGVKDWLQLSKDWPHGWEAIRDAVDQHLYVHAQVEELVAVEEAGKGSAPTVGEGQS